MNMPNIAMPKITLPKINLDMKKLVPALLLGAIGLAGFYLYIIYQQTLDPEVIAAQAQAAEKAATLVQAKAQWWQAFGASAPSVAVSVGYSIIGVTLGVGILLLIIAVSSKIILRSMTDAVEKGFAYVEDGPNGITTKYLVSPNTVVAAHLAAKYGPSAVADLPMGSPVKPVLDATATGGDGGDGKPQVRPGDVERSKSPDAPRPSGEVAGAPRTAAATHSLEGLRDAAASTIAANRDADRNSGSTGTNRNDHAGSTVGRPANGNSRTNGNTGSNGTTGTFRPGQRGK